MFPATTLYAASVLPTAEPPPRRYAYAFVLGAVALGWLAPGVCAGLLAPVLLGGMVVLGVAHGACDQFVVPATHPQLGMRRGRYWTIFLTGYLGLAATVGGLWWWRPGAALALFFGLTAWHWGSADAPARVRHRTQWVAHSVLRGTLLFAVPFWHWPNETSAIVRNLLALTGATYQPATGGASAGLGVLLAVLGGLSLLWLSYWRGQQAAVVRTDALETGLLVALLVVLPPVLAAGVYFVFWHSLQHVLRMNQLMGGAPVPRRLWAGLGFFLRRAAPLLLISLGALALVFGLAWSLQVQPPVLVSLALLAASIVTLPHALLVTLGLDRARWRHNSGHRAGPTG